jgi:hypothetical protein
MKLLLALALAGAAAMARAETWTVTYHDLAESTGLMGNDLVNISVIFTGHDGNGDGLVDQAEVSNLTFRLFSTDFTVQQEEPFTFNVTQQSIQAYATGIAPNGEDSIMMAGTSFSARGGAPLEWDFSHAAVTVEVVGAVSQVPEPASGLLAILGITLLCPRPFRARWMNRLTA